MKHNKLFIHILTLLLLSFIMLKELKSQDVNLQTQAQVNAFVGSSITGSLNIQENIPGDITNLDALSTLTSIGGDLRIGNNTSLTNIDGLINVVFLGGALSIYENELLTNINGLTNITGIINGTLSIHANNSLINIDGLSGISSAISIISITSNPLLLNLNGLSGISSTGSTLYITNCNSIVDVAGLINISSIGVDLVIFSNASLVNLDGLSNINSVGGDVYIADHTALVSIAGLSNINSIPVHLEIVDNPVLPNLNGLHNITSVGGDLIIDGNSIITNVNELSGITSVGSSLIVTNNNALVSISDLSNISSIPENLEIVNNPVLSNLNGLENLTSVGGNLEIIENSTLSDFCSLFNLFNTNGLTGTYTVTDNLTNPTEADIISAGPCPPLPVELTTFTATTSSSAGGTVSVDLNWETATEVNNYGFEIEKQNAEVSSQQTEWEKLTFVQGHGNSNSPKFYSFSDKSVSSGKYNYRLKQIDIDGSYEYSDIVEVDLGLPSEFELSQNYPNPFNPTTTISYSIPVVDAKFATTTNVELKIYDVLGKEVATLVNEQKSAGNYKVEFDASTLTSGIYFYTIRSGKFFETKKMLLMK